jgi:hypothetical protein
MNAPMAPNLAGTWHFTSMLHLHDALSGPIQVLLDAGQVGRDLTSGNLRDLGLPGILSSILGGIVSGFIDQFVPPWARDVLQALGDMHDILDNMQVQADINLTEVCPDVYRGKEHWMKLMFEYRGVQVSKRPEDIPEIGMVQPEDFSARVMCGELYIDKHRINNTLKNFLRWLLNDVIAAVTCESASPTACFRTPEDALNGIIDCENFAQFVENQVGDPIPFVDTYSVVDAGCNGVKRTLISKVQSAINTASTTFGLLAIQGEAHVTSANALDMGKWDGSLFGGDFPGEFTATK